jgi:hypothetical protein
VDIQFEIQLLHKKGIVEMRRGGVVFIVAVTLAACTQIKIMDNRNAIRQIQLGDGLETVIKTLGLPVFRRDIAEQSFVVYYRTRFGRSLDSPVTISMCTPITIQNRQVVAIGDEMTDAWSLEADNGQHRAGPMEQNKPEHFQRQTTVATQAKTVQLTAASNAKIDLQLYNKLLELDPDNVLYQKKVAFSKGRLAAQDKGHGKNTDSKAISNVLRIWEQTRDVRNKNLRKYTGNGIASMAIQDMGDGSLYVWVRNVSQRILTVHPEHFSLVDNNHNKTRCQISDSLGSTLVPGSISHGEISYRKDIIPKNLILQIPGSAQIKKNFQ